MSHKAAFEALDVTMKDLRRNNDRMGGVVMVLAGDFRQTLPVIPRGTRADEMQACIKSSYIWNGIQTLGLSTNMRVHLNGDPSAQQFADNLLKLGNGALTSENEDGYVAMQGIGRIVTTEEELKEAVFPNVIHTTSLITHGCAKEQFLPQQTKPSVLSTRNFYRTYPELFIFTNL
ncbi:uncharacterized protein LOC118179924 [Stegodyphus dumicola]|uniref:uncharacterized protein LOC118179924 n=1 Tax=Stegodyphus dumicola TaxID=202533 RepID=UPI0015A8FDFC|nr:uncharacterized protein LOC118179924 [Stegodyphus dumicola]